MLSSDYETKIKINKRELLSCIDRATLLVKEGDKKPIIMNVTEGNMELKIQSFIGSMNEDIDIEKEGKDILIGFNPKFFIDALRVIDDEEVTLYMVNPKAPCFIKDDQGSYIYLILPVNFNNVANSGACEQMETIRIKDEYIRLGQALKLAGLVGSGVDAKMVIQDGLVKVNGETEYQRGKKLHDKDVVTYEGESFQVETCL